MAASSTGNQETTFPPFGETLPGTGNEEETLRRTKALWTRQHQGRLVEHQRWQEKSLKTISEQQSCLGAKQREVPFLSFSRGGLAHSRASPPRARGSSRRPS